MQIEALKTFCDVVRLRSFSRAAQENRILQSSASQTVSALEEHLGVALIDRSHRPWELTAQGKAFYEGCREVLDRYFDLETRVKDIHEDVSAVVRVTAIYSVGLRHMNRYVEGFSALYPTAKVQVDYLHPDRVYERVLEGAADFGIVSCPQARRELTVIPWREEPMVLACLPEHRLAKRKQVPVPELRGEKFVGFDRGLAVRRMVDRFLKKHGVEVDVTAEFDNIEAIKRAIEAGSGVSILPRPTLDREVASGSLAAVPFTTNELVRPLGIIHRRGKKFYPNAARFIELLQNGENGNGK